MTSTSIPNKYISLNNDEILYSFYSYDGLHYVVDMLKGYYDSYRKMGQGKDPLFDKKCNMIKFEIITHFCHYAEQLGAFLYPCHEVNPSFSSAEILENLTKYHVWQIDNFYEDFSDSYALDDIRRNNFNRLFGYDRIKRDHGAAEMINLSLTNILDVVKAIAEFYNFWKDSYNAYKHGYRLWYGHEYKQDLDVVLYLRKYNKLVPQNSMESLPTDDETIVKIYNLTKSCHHIFDIIFDNNRALLKVGKTSDRIQYGFLDYKEPTTKIIRKEFKI
jgi:hypothetical protein